MRDMGQRMNIRDGKTCFNGIESNKVVQLITNEVRKGLCPRNDTFYSFPSLFRSPLDTTYLLLSCLISLDLYSGEEHSQSVS